MNVYDGERMTELLGAQGLTVVDDNADADLVVLNTCHIREKAAEKAYSDIGRLKRDDGSRPIIALAGCVAQAEGAEAKARSRMIDIVVGPQAYHRLPEMVAAVGNGKRTVDTDMAAGIGTYGLSAVVVLLGGILWLAAKRDFKPALISGLAIILAAILFWPRPPMSTVPEVAIWNFCFWSETTSNTESKLIEIDCCAAR